MSSQQHKTLVHSLLESLRSNDEEAPCNSVETHISTVLICADRVYKIKKPVDFGFLDFTSLEARHFYCNEEIRLNRRLAPEVYLDTIAITGTPEQPQLGGTGPIIDYAVRMRRFDQHMQLDRLLQRGQLDGAIIDRLAQRMSEFHAAIERSPAEGDFGAPRQVVAPMLENFVQVRHSPLGAYSATLLQALEEWTQGRYAQLQELLRARLAQGHIRECHGDMHLGNMAWIDNDALIFDGIEFNANLRWIDTISELAFASMDLAANGQPSLASRLVNAYLEHSGDYHGLPLLDFYQLYRAMVRAKVTALSADVASGLDAAQAAMDRYLRLARGFTRASSGQLILVGGYSATGKSTLSSKLLTNTRIVRLRSDRERKRLFAADETATDELNRGLYSPQLTRQTYEHLLATARNLLSHGFTVIVDATFLKRAQRLPFQQLAQDMGMPCTLLWLDAPTPILMQRMAARRTAADNISDADEQVIRYQKNTAQEPDTNEAVVRIDTSEGFDIESIRRRIRDIGGEIDP